MHRRLPTGLPISVNWDGSSTSLPNTSSMYTRSYRRLGEEFGITNIGYRAVDSLRLEKRYLAWGVDITPDYNPYEAGLQFLIDWDKGDFIGAEALARIRQDGVQQKLVCLALNDPLPVFGGEAIFCGDRVVAQTTSGNFGYSTGKSLVLGYLPVDVLEHSDLMIEAFGEAEFGIDSERGDLRSEARKDSLLGNL